MTEFITENFLLQNKTAQTLYHEYASKCPFTITTVICPPI